MSETNDWADRFNNGGEAFTQKCASRCADYKTCRKEKETQYLKVRTCCTLHEGKACARGDVVMAGWRLLLVVHTGIRSRQGALAGLPRSDHFGASCACVRSLARASLVTTRLGTGA